MIAKIIFYALGVVVALAAVGTIALLYHIQTQELWREITREEFEERYARDLERRWENQDIRIHAQLVIVDETSCTARRAHIKHRQAG